MRLGFTLIELVIVIVVIGIVAMIAIPVYQDLSLQARIGATQGALGAIRSAESMAYARHSLAGTKNVIVDCGTIGSGIEQPVAIAAACTASLETSYAPPVLPVNALTGKSGFEWVFDVPSQLETHPTAGFWFVSEESLPRTGAYSDGVVDTSGW